MLSFLHTHHAGEDALMFPLLRERAVIDPELMDRIDAQHALVNDSVEAVGMELQAWTTSAEAAAGERMAGRIEEMMPTLLGHRQFTRSTNTVRGDEVDPVRTARPVSTRRRR